MPTRWPHRKGRGSTIPLFIENAADFCVVDNPHFSKDSVVVIESISGDTKEVVAAVDKAQRNRSNGYRVCGRRKGQSAL